jgi:alpha-L-fucosidase
MRQKPIQRRTFLKSAAGSALLALAPRLRAGDSAALPPYLEAYRNLYQSDPHAAALAWFRDARFGLFVHFALASVLDRGKPEYLELTAGLENEIEINKLPRNHAGRSGTEAARLKRIEKIHQDLMRRFHAERFDAEAICDLAVAAGMRYVNITTKHLGRLALYRTTTTGFNSLNAPAGRDLVGELAEACAARRLGLFLYVPGETSRTDGPLFERNRIVLRELLTQYGPIAGIWFDGIAAFNKTPDNYARLSELYALIRELQPQCLVSFKEGAIGREDFTSPEHFHMAVPTAWNTPQRQARWDLRMERWNRLYTQRWDNHFKDKPVEINTTMQECLGRDGFGAPGGWINDESARHLSADEVMYLLAKARGASANLLMNIGPRADGSIHPDDDKALRIVGKAIRERDWKLQETDDDTTNTR